MSAVFLPIALIAYVVGVFLTVLATVYRSRISGVAAIVVVAIAWLFHLSTIVSLGLEVGSLPLSNLGEYLLLLGCAVTTLHLLIWARWRVDAAGLVLPPLGMLAAFGSFGLLNGAGATPLPRPRGMFLFHTTVSTLGMAMLCVALAMSLIYLVQDRALKSRRTLRLLERMPPLDRCDRIGFHSLLIGFILLTLGIVTGVAVNSALYERLWVLGVKQTLPVLAWGVFAVVLFARFKVGFRGRKSAYLTITGVALGLLTVAGMTL